MKTRRSLSVFLHLFVLVALTLVGCAAPPETSTVPTQQTQPATAAPTTQDGIPLAFADPNKKVRIALVREVGEGSFFERYLAGAQSMANELGVELLEATARGDMAKMVTAMENFIQQGVDAIIVDHGRPDPLLPKIEEALAKGIKVVSFDLVVDNPQVPEIEQDDMLIGFLLAKKVVTDHGGQADVVYVNVGGFAPLDKRDRIWQSFKWRYPGLKEVTRIGAVTDNTAADTQTRMEATMKEYPNANVVVAMWDEFAKGAVRAITQAGRAKDYQVYSVDITNEDIQLMIAPDSPWVATVATDSYSVGRLAVRTAAALVAGEKVDKYLLVPPQLITRDFLLANKITNMDELIQAMPAMGESPLNWFPWMEKVLVRNGYSMPQIAVGAGAEMSSQPICQVKSDQIPNVFTNKKVRIALVREVGEGSFFERYLAGAQSMANELGVELLEATARGDMAKMVTAMENFIQQGVDAIIVDHGRPDPLLPKIEEALAKGIKVVSFDLVVDNPQVPEIEQDDMLIGFLLAKKVVTDHAGQADVVYVNVGGFAPLDKRDRIWQDFKWRYPGLKEVTRIGAVTDNTAADTQTRMEATMKEYPNANVVVAMWDEFAKGAVRAITQAGRAKDYQVYSVDITNEDIQLMIAPDSPWVATVATDSYSVGRLAVRTAAALVAGEKVDKYLLVQPQLITRDFLLANKITNMDELIQAMPAMGESSLNWFPWMEKVLARNGYSMPQITIGAGGEMSSQPICQVKSDQIPSVFTNKKVRIALVREVGEGSFFERYLAGAQSMANELGVELLEATARGDMAKMVTAMENFIQQGVDAIIVDHGRPDPLLPKIEEALAKGIKVVSFDLVVDNPQVPEIEQDDMLIGFLLAKKVVTDHAGQADVVYVNVGGFAPLDKRDRIWQDFKWRYPGLKEVTRIGAVTDNTAADTQTRMEATMKEYPNANVVVAMWDEFAKGAVRAITQAGRGKDYRVYSVDITNEDIQLMIAPDSPWVATVATDSYSVGRLAVRTAAALVAGEKVDKYLLVQPQLITRDFLLANKITNMDELIQAMPAMGESPLNWFPWMCTLAGR